jgi:hypothetical protein
MEQRKLSFEEFLVKFPMAPEDLAVPQEHILDLAANEGIDWHEQLVAHQHREYKAYLDGDPFYCDQLDTDSE